MVSVHRSSEMAQNKIIKRGTVCLRGIRQRINNIKLQNKLASIYIVTGLIPLFILFSFAFGQMRSILMDRDLRSMLGSLEQSVATVDGQIEVYNNLSNYITFNETVSSVLAYDYGSTYEMYSQIVTTFDPMLSSLKYFHNDINRVTVYVDNGIKHDTTIAPVDEIKNKPFYSSAAGSTAINWYVDKDNKKLISARKMSTLEQMGITGIIYIDVDYDSVMSSYRQGLESNCGIIVVDGNGTVIGEFNNFDDNDRYILNYSDNSESDGTTEKVTLEKMISEASWNGNTCNNADGYALIRKESPVTGWTTYVYEPRKLMLRPTNSIIAMIIVAVAVALLGLAAAIISTSGFITKRIKKLQASMAKVEQGDFDAVIQTEDKDEIGELIQGFNGMTTQTKNLITQVYEGRISQKESEMRALRAQINPHFLYNSLSLINWKAIEYEQDDISRITLALSNYYRTSLNKGKNTLLLEQEVSNARSYIEIQQIMHDNSFDVTIDISEDILKVESLNLILQPLVENAIDHGIDLLTDRRGMITIKGSRRPYRNRAGESIDIVWLSVSDNGVGMDENVCASFLTAESKGYGARNVNDRIRLFYGEEYHLAVESIAGEGTTIMIKFPVRQINDNPIS